MRTSRTTAVARSMIVLGAIGAVPVLAQTITYCVISTQYDACVEYLDPFGTANCTGLIPHWGCPSLPETDDECGSVTIDNVAGQCGTRNFTAQCTWRERSCGATQGSCINGGTSGSLRQCEAATGSNCPSGCQQGGGGPPKDEGVLPP